MDREGIMTRVTRLLIAVPVLVLAAAGVARGGSLDCQFDVSAFANDVAAAKGRLSAQQLKSAEQVILVARSQCRSSTDMVGANLTSARKTLQLTPADQQIVEQDSFWPSRHSELAEIRK